MKIFSPILKGTTTVSQGTTNLSGSFTGSLFGTAATASYADNFTVGGTLTAQTINVQIITSSIEFNTGSTRNGALSTNTHQFTGSVLMSGSLGIGTSSPDALLTVAGANQPLGGAFNTYGNALIYSTDSFAINKGGSLSFGGKYYSAVNTIETFARIHGKKESATDGATSGYLAFETTNDATALLTERMRITSGGSILIGTATDNSSGAGNILHQVVSETAAFVHRGPYNIANGGTKTLDVQNGSLIFISENNTGDGALFHACYISATVTIIANPSGRFANTDTASKICVFKSAANGYATLKNNAGSTFQFTTYIIKNSD
jgi:hypothetical protein